MSKSDLHIDILGANISISTDEDKIYLDKLLEKYRTTIENVQRRTGIKDPLKTAILTGFLLCDDLEKAVHVSPEQSLNDEAEHLTLGMISRLDAVMPDNETAHENIFRLQNPVKYYEWGSTEWLPAFLGQINSNHLPWAELWMGVHDAGPSCIELPGGNSILLSELIDQDAEQLLGKEVWQKYGVLPFLFKVLAAEKPLSLQVHPALDAARVGFEREQRLGIPLDAPNRNYRDPNHKQELLCAISPFVSLCGFRKEQEISTLIESLSQGAGQALKTGLDKLSTALEDSPSCLRTFLSELYALENKEVKTMALYFTSAQESLVKEFPQYRDVWQICSYLSNNYPNDPCILAPLYLNIIELESGQAIFIPAGVFHSHIKGTALELMTNSDNILRGGLTAKHVDREEVFNVLDFSEYKPKILHNPNNELSWYSYPAPIKDFSLSVMRGKGNAVPYPNEGPSILLINEGIATVKYMDREMIVKTGESLFIPAGENNKLLFSGIFTAHIASAQ